MPCVHCADNRSRHRREFALSQEGADAVDAGRAASAGVADRNLLIVFLPTGVSLISEASWAVSWPELRGFNFSGGTVLTPEFVALLGVIYLVFCFAMSRYSQRLEGELNRSTRR